MGRLLRCFQKVAATEEGYYWVRASPDAGQIPAEELDPGEKLDILTDGCRFGSTEPVMMRQYNALAERSLLRDFASLYVPIGEAFEDSFRLAVSRFATQYGYLGVRPVRFGTLYVGELVSDWWNNVRDVRNAVDIWDRVRITDNSARTTALRDVVQWKSDCVNISLTCGHAMAAHEPLSGDRTSHAFGSRRWESLQPGAMVKPAKWFLQDQVNTALSGSLNGRVLWAGRPGEGRFEFHFTPKNLLAAIWCLLAREMAGEDILVCEYCGKPIQDQRRSTRRFCNNVCRAMHSQRRKGKSH